MKWLEKASTHVKQFERIVRKKKLSCVQLWCRYGLMYGIREKKGAIWEDARGTFWIGKAIDMEAACEWPVQ